jgi:predicted SprT family Zn-dependent metalloprotease
MKPTPGGTIEATIQDLLRGCGARWGLQGFAESVRVEWGRGFRRSLGRVYLERRVVRLAPELGLAPIAVLREVVCHEVAHLAARDLHGGRCRPHGPEWMALVRLAGFEPRRRMPWTPSPAPGRIARRRRQYVHRCPVCQAQRTAWRPVRQWRCAACVAAGLSGHLEISSPSGRGPA